MDCINERNCTRLEDLEKRLIQVNKTNLLGTKSHIMLTMSHFKLPLSLALQDLCRFFFKYPEYKGECDGWRPSVIWKCTGSAPMFEDHDQMISLWHQWSGRFLFPGYVMRDGQRFSGDQWKLLVIQGTSCKKLLRKLRFIKHMCVHRRQREETMT